MIRFGGPIFLDAARAAGAGESHGAAADDPVALARAHTAKGYTAAYAPRVSLTDTDKIRAIRQAFAAEGVMIAEVGFWQNLLDTDPETRRAHRQLMLESLALAEELGARCAVDILGSYCHGNGNSQHVAKNFSSEAFDAAVELARYFLDEVQPKTACFTYEIFPFNVVDSPEMIEKLIHAVDRPQFGVHLDLVNLINSPRAYWGSGEIMRDCVRRFGDRIVAGHIKDLKMREPAISVILEEVPAGQGAIDLATALTEVNKLPQQVPYMLEHLRDEEEYDQAAAHVRAVAQSVGIAIEEGDMPTIATNGLNLAYEERGQGDPVLLLMGLGADKSKWEDHVRALEPHFRCLLVDNRGAGQSDKPPGPYTTRMMAEDAAGLLEALDLPAAHVAGISMGSCIAQELALAYPEKVRSLVLISTWARCDEYMKAVFDSFRRLRAVAPLPDFMQMLQLWIFSAAHFSSHLDDMRQGQADAVIDPMPPHAFDAQCEACLTHDTLKRLAEIQQPTLITVGDRDIFTPLWCAVEVHERLPNAILDVFPGTGHAHHWEVLEEFNRRVLGFLRGQAAGGGERR